MERGQRMKNSQDEHRMMIDAIPMMAWCSLPDGSVQFLNQPWLDFTGLSLQGALGWKWRAAIHPDDLEGLIDPWRGMLASGQPGEMEARLRRFDGEYRWFLFRAAAMRDDLGNIVNWHGVNIDIEDRKRAESLLAAEKRSLEMIAGGAPLTDILRNLCDTIDAQASNIISAAMLMGRTENACGHCRGVVSRRDGSRRSLLS